MASVVCGRWMQLYRDLALRLLGIGGLCAGRRQAVIFSNKYESSLDFLCASLRVDL